MAADDRYDIGDVVECGVVFGDVDENTIDPDTVTFSLLAPDGTSTERVYGVGALVIRDARGEYRTDVDVEQSGMYFFRWHGTGTGQSASEDWFTARRSRFAD